LQVRTNASACFRDDLTENRSFLFRVNKRVEFLQIKKAASFMTLPFLYEKDDLCDQPVEDKPSEIINEWVHRLHSAWNLGTAP
jgi:hypothetical protein